MVSALDQLRRFVVVLAEKADEAVDEVAYRPAVVKATERLPRWWRCDLAKLSRLLDERWSVGWWDEDVPVPRGLCEACGRRAAIHVYGGDGGSGVLADQEVETCGWCNLEGRILTKDDLRIALRDARSRSVSWSWRAG